MAYTKISGVYQILCVPSAKVYVGSAVSIRQRWACHRSKLTRGIHDNLHLQNAWLKYSVDAFEFSILETCAVADLVATEQKWIDSLQAAKRAHGMNNSPTATTSIGFRHSEETKARLALLASSRDFSRLRALAESQKGKPGHSLGKPGKKWTEEQRQAASQQRKGRIAWNVGIPNVKRS